MQHDKRRSYRCNVSREIAQAELVVNQCARKVVLLNESTGGYLVHLKGKSDFKVDALGLLKTAGGWYNVKILRRNVTEDGVRYGLLRVGAYQPPPQPSDCLTVWRSALGTAMSHPAQRSSKGGSLLVWLGLGSVAMLAATFLIYMARPALFQPARAQASAAVPVDITAAAAALGELSANQEKAAAAVATATVGGGNVGAVKATAVAGQKLEENVVAHTVAPVVEKAVDTTVSRVAEVTASVAALAAAPAFDPRNFNPLRRLDLLTSADFIKRLQLSDSQSQRISQIQAQSLREIEQLRQQAGLTQENFDKQAQALAEQAEQAAHRVLSADQREKFINFYGPIK